MRELKIAKGGGRYRTVVVPSARRKQACRAELPRLMAAAITLDVYGVQHGFSPARSPVTCAAVHRGYGYTASWDLADCFGHVQRSHVPMQTPDHCWHGDIARQGLPTSPPLANIALSGLDADIVRALAGRGVYTRYADDLIVSSDDRDVIGEMLSRMPSMVAAHGHELAAHKTSVQSARAGRRHITGVAVDTDLQPTRDARRKLRAAGHRPACLLFDALRASDPLQGIICLAAARQAQIVHGLSEWCALRPPSWALATLACQDDLLRAALTSRGA